MIRPKNTTEDLLLSIAKIVQHLLNKSMQDLKKRSNLKRPNQEKRFISNHQFKLKKVG